MYFPKIFDDPFCKISHFQSFLNVFTVFIAIYQIQSKDSRLLPFFKKRNYGPFLWMGFNCLNVKCPGVPGTHFINPGRMKG